MKGIKEIFSFFKKKEEEPNHAHKMLAEVEKWHDVTIITQNVDNLHERAGSTHVIHLHGVHYTQYFGHCLCTEIFLFSISIKYGLQ